MDSSELTRLYDFSGQTVVITGGTGTLGGEIACALVGCGANVAMLDRNLDPAQGILELMEPRANQAVAVHADVLDPESLGQAGKSATLCEIDFGPDAFVGPSGERLHDKDLPRLASPLDYSGGHPMNVIRKQGYG